MDYEPAIVSFILSIPSGELFDYVFGDPQR